MTGFLCKTKKLAPIIVDVHQHLGTCRVFDYKEQTEEDIIRNMDEKGIDASIVQPFPGAFPQPPKAEHDRIARMAENHPGRIFGICSANPHVITRDEWILEAQRCIEELGFVAIKLHTIGHSLLPTSKDGMMIFEIAHQLNVPVMIHTGLGGQLASPAQVIPAARKWPDLPIVLAHAGFPTQSPDAVYIASLLENVILEWSWGMADDIRWSIKELGVEKNLFASDLMDNTMTEQVKAAECGLTEEELEWFLGKTAIKIFRLPL